MRRYFALVSCLVIFCTFLFEAEGVGAAELHEQKIKKSGATPEQEQVEMEKTFQQMGPAMGSMMEGMMGAMFRFLAKPETAENLATFTKNYYDALVRKGFSKEQALRIVISVGVPRTMK